MSAIAVDCETALIRPGCLAPEPACVSTALSATDYDLFHWTEAREVVEGILNSDFTIVGHNIAFDMAVFAAKWPDLLPLIFEVYAADRVSDTGIREKLNHLGLGVLRKFERSDGEWVHLEYRLADLARRHLGVEMEKGTWQLRFGELIDKPLAWWPEEARQYALVDAVATHAIWERQEADRQFFEDEFRQVRAEWWLHLMSCWGLHTDLAGVREFERLTQQKYGSIAEELFEAGVVRIGGTKKEPKLVRNTKVVQGRVVQAYTAAGKVVPMTKGGKKGPAGAKPMTDADTCDRSGDPILEKYAELSSLTKTLSTDIPLLEQGTIVPLQARFETLLETGRTSSTPNVQNLPTDIGVRECFVPRPGWVYASADFSQFELRTWSQVCIHIGIGSKMAEALNSGNDPHLELARRILGISYEQAQREYKDDPKGRVYHPRQASKSGNFGFPGGLGIVRFREYARKNYGVVLTEAKATELREFWYETWPEAREYFKWVNTKIESENPPRITQIFSNRVRGNVSFTEASNGLFQALAADAAKAAGFLVARACYVDQDSPLYGCRPVDFIHDEEIVEVPDDEFAADAAEELARLMRLGASPFLPDVPPVCEGMLARRWSKAAKPMRENGRLVPWDFPTKQAAE